MKKLFLSLVLFSFVLLAEAQKHYALLVIDIQNFYFPGGRSELVDPAAAAQKAAGSSENSVTP
ncbi:MAG: hypothetical protein L0Y37_02265 [Bacteroidales bacterium]|nr:hypothetical protein [Bacteroidales bacterium]